MKAYLVSISLYPTLRRINRTRLDLRKGARRGGRGKAEIESLVSKRSLEVRDLYKTVTRKEVVAALCIALGKPDLGNQCRLYKRFGGVQAAVVRLTDADARRLLGLGRLRIGWVNCRIRQHVEVARCFRCQGYCHVSRGCTLPGSKDDFLRCGETSRVARELKASPRYLTCADRGEKSCYFSPNDSFEIFETQILLLEESLKEASGRSLIATFRIAHFWLSILWIRY